MLFSRWSRLEVGNSDTHHWYRVYLRDTRGEYLYCSGSIANDKTTPEAFAKIAADAQIAASQTEYAPDSLNSLPQGRINPFS